MVLEIDFFSPSAHPFKTPERLLLSLTQVFPIKGRLAQEPCEAGHIPKAQVDPLTGQRMNTMGCITAQKVKSQSLLKVFNRQPAYHPIRVTNTVFIHTVLPNECCPMADVLRRMTHAQRKHDPTLGADPRHAGRKLPRRTCRWHDGRQGTAEQRAGCLDQLRLVLVTPLFFWKQEEDGDILQKKLCKKKKKKPKRDRKKYRFEWMQKLADTGVKSKIQASESIFPLLSNKPAWQSFTSRAS